MTDDIVIAKADIIRRCIKRVEAEYRTDEIDLADDIRAQDMIVLNIQRACEAAIDLAMHLVRVFDLGVPQDSKDAFYRLFTGEQITRELQERLTGMVGFRNIAVHNYRALDLAVVESVATERIYDLERFVQRAIELTESPTDSK